MPDVHSPEQRSFNMSQIRRRDTKPEVLLRSLLHRAGYRFRIDVAGLPGRPDIVLRKYNTAIQVHGCYWHRHEGCPKCTTPETNKKIWEEKFRRNIERDRRNEEALRQQGWNVLIVWECELSNAPQEVLSKITSALRQNRHGSGVCEI